MFTAKRKTVTFISSLFVLAIFTLFITACQSQDYVRSDALLDNVISKDENEFMFEGIAWGQTKQDLMKDNHIPEKGVTEGASESFILDDTVTFKDPKSDATVIYRFQDDVFIGGEYSIEAEDEDDLVDIASTLKDQLKEAVGEPDSNSLDELSEESVRRGSNGVAYLNDDESTLGISFPQNEKLIIGISISGPRDVLEKHILDKQD